MLRSLTDKCHANFISNSINVDSVNVLRLFVRAFEPLLGRVVEAGCLGGQDLAFL